MQPYESLKSICSKRPFRGPLLIICPDTIRRARSIEYAFKLLEIEPRGPSVQSFEASALTNEQIRSLKDSSLTLSIFSSSMFVVFRNIDKTPAAIAKEIEALIFDERCSTQFLCTASTASQKSTLLKAFPSAQTVEFKKLEGAELLKWAAQEAKRQGIKNVHFRVIEDICRISLDDPDAISSLIEKLSLLGDGENITAAELEQLESFQEAIHEFRFVDLVAHGRRRDAYAFVEQLDATGASAFPLLGLLSKMFSNYLRIKIGARNSSQAALGAKLGISPWAFKKQLQSAQAASEVKLVRLLKSVLRADSQIKNKNLGEPTVLVEMINNAST